MSGRAAKGRHHEVSGGVRSVRLTRNWSPTLSSGRNAACHPLKAYLLPSLRRAAELLHQARETVQLDKDICKPTSVALRKAEVAKSAAAILDQLEAECTKAGLETLAHFIGVSTLQAQRDSKQRRTGL